MLPVATTAHTNWEILVRWQGGQNLFLLYNIWAITIYPRSRVWNSPDFHCTPEVHFQVNKCCCSFGKKKEKKLYLGLLPLASCISAWPCFWCKTFFYFKRKGQSHASGASLLWCFGPLMDIAAEFIWGICQLDPCAQLFGSCCINLAHLTILYESFFLSTKAARKHVWAAPSAFMVHWVWLSLFSSLFCVPTCTNAMWFSPHDFKYVTFYPGSIYNGSCWSKATENQSLEFFYSAHEPRFRERRNIIDLSSGNFLSSTCIGLLTVVLKLNPFFP